MTQSNIAASQITLIDLNDAIIAGTAPLNPANDTLWIDNSTTPAVLKKWSASSSQWITQTLSLSGLDPSASQNLGNAVTLLNNMASDSVITQSERLDVKADITDIIGFVPMDNNYAVQNFAAKVTASTTANANVSKYSGSTSIQSPTGSWTENIQSYYDNIATQNSVVFTIATGTTNGGIAQALYQFDLVQHIARTYGYTPSVTWLDNNIKQLKLIWKGYASSLNGNKAYVDAWNTTSNAKWNAPVNTTSGTIATLTWDSTVNQTNIQNLIDASGKVNFIGYTDAAGLVTNPSTAPTLALAVNAGSTLTATTHYVKYTWVTPNGETQGSPEASIAVTAGNNLVVTIPSLPFGVTQAKIYMSTTTGTETYQGNTTGTTYTRSTVLATGAAMPASNTAIVSASHNTDYVELQVTLHPIPTTSGLDALGAGSFASTRKAALNAGILGTDTNYTNLANQYTTLKTYLEGLTPVYPWNVLTNDVISIVGSTWRNNWNNYYLAEYQLNQTIAQALKSNADNINVGGRNLLQNTALFDTSDAYSGLEYWALSNGSAVAGSLDIYADPVYGNVIHATMTTNASGSNTWWVLENDSLTLPNKQFTVGQTYTLSFLIKNGIPLYVNFMDGNGANQVTTNKSISTNANWTKIVYTFTATATGNTPIFYLSKNDSTSTGDVYLTQLKLEVGNRNTDWSVSPEEIGNILSDLLTRVGNAEQKITDDAITSTVTNSTTFNNYMSGKASATDLSNYATAQQLSDTADSINAATDGKIAGIDFSPYVTQAQLTQTSDAINAKFASGGGINLLKNSVGYSSTDFWTITGTCVTTQTAELNPYGSRSGFSLNGGTLKQVITALPNMSYTVAAYVKKGTAGTGYLKLYESPGVNEVPANLVSGTAYSYQLITATINTIGNQFTVEINGDATSGGVIFTSLMANVGTVPLQWSEAPGEMYNTNINFDLNGIRVSQTSNGVITGITVMTPTKFAGYSDVDGNGNIDQTTGSNDEVFRMDKDSFVMKTATIKPIKIIPVTTGGHNGIAFVPSS